MTPDIESAARRLLESIDAPRGLINVLAWPEVEHSKIRVFVDPMARLMRWPVPSQFEGFPVEVEFRVENVPFS
jgi:hypothetical protein